MAWPHSTNKNDQGLNWSHKTLGLDKVVHTHTHTAKNEVVSKWIHPIDTYNLIWQHAPTRLASLVWQVSWYILYLLLCLSAIVGIRLRREECLVLGKCKRFHGPWNDTDTECCSDSLTASGRSIITMPTQTNIGLNSETGRSMIFINPRTLGCSIPRAAEGTPNGPETL